MTVKLFACLAPRYCNKSICKETHLLAKCFRLQAHETIFSGWTLYKELSTCLVRVVFIHNTDPKTAAQRLGHAVLQSGLQKISPDGIFTNGTGEGPSDRDDEEAHGSSDLSCFPSLLSGSGGLISRFIAGIPRVTSWFIRVIRFSTASPIRPSK